MKKIKQGKDGKLRLGRKQVVKVAIANLGNGTQDIHAYKTSGRLVVYEIPKPKSPNPD